MRGVVHSNKSSYTPQKKFRKFRKKQNPKSFFIYKILIHPKENFEKSEKNLNPKSFFNYKIQKKKLKKFNEFF